MNVYLSIGNSDDKLTQKEWAQYVADMSGAVVARAKQIHGTWFSLPACPWQNANWCLEFADEDMEAAKDAAVEVRMRWRQDSVAWAVAEPEFI